MLSYLVLAISLSACAAPIQTQAPVSRSPNFPVKSTVLFSSAVAATDSMGWKVVGSDSEQSAIEARSRDGGAESPSFHISLTYRKALEFLIKDFLISQIDTESEAEKAEKTAGIKSRFLSDCITDDLESQQVADVASRAAWLGNDEIHYERRWEDKDITDLIALVELSANIIQNIFIAAKYKQDMP